MAFTRQVANTPSAYGWVSIGFHWVVALGVIGLYPLGLYIDSLSYYDPAYRVVPDWHKGIGILLAATLIARLLWRVMQTHPSHIQTHTRFERLATKVVHSALYILLLVVFISGYMISTSDGRAISVFGWFEVPALPAIIDNQEDVAGDIHFYVATTLIVLAGLHAAAALKHHFIDKDTTLTRMLGVKETS